MTKRAFYPAAIILFGLIEMANLLGYFPVELRTFWPILMIIVGLGGILTADKEAWLTTERKTSSPATKTGAKKASRRR